MAANPPPMPRTVEEVFNDFNGRRVGLVKALNPDFHRFYRMCDPERECLSLFGLPDGTWEVKMPETEPPPVLPEPALGINISRCETPVEDWKSLVAIHSDSWLLSVAFCYGGILGFDKNDRGRLFEMINAYPTVYEDIIPKAVRKKQQAVRLHNNGSNSKSQQSEPVPNVVTVSAPEAVIAVKKRAAARNKQGTTSCDGCGGEYEKDEFWIGCDTCDRWVHGACVAITQEKADRIGPYMCPPCMRNKKPRV